MAKTTPVMSAFSSKQKVSISTFCLLEPSILRLAIKVLKDKTSRNPATKGKTSQSYKILIISSYFDGMYFLSLFSSFVYSAARKKEKAINTANITAKKVSAIIIKPELPIN